MSYVDIRLSESIEQNANFKYLNNTSIVTTSSGAEQRNANWSQFRLSADVSYPIQRKETLQEIIDHYILMRGQLFSFPFKNWDMFRIGDPRDNTYQRIGFGDGSTVGFQIKKLFELGAINYEKDILKPATGGKVYIDGVLQTITTDYTIDLLTGIITFTSAPANLAEIQYCGEFYVPMRYASDSLNVLATMYLQNYEIASIPAVSLIEVRGE
jgi:uncharacterized protein (TIGR02217 family)